MAPEPAAGHEPVKCIHCGKLGTHRVCDECFKALPPERTCQSISPRNLGLVQCQRDDDHNGRHEATNRDGDDVSWTGENSAD